MQTRDVVTCFLQRGGRVLVLRRSGRVRTYPGKWAAVSGTLERPDVAAEALREVREETGLGAHHLNIVRTAPPLTVRDEALGVEWRVHPVLAELDGEIIPRLNWEHTEARWVAPRELRNLDAVPALAEAWEALHA